MEWINLTEASQLDLIKELSAEKSVVIFKHSIRCSISSMAKSRLERQVQPAGVPFYYLDLINYRQLSNAVAADFQVQHQSPQVLIIRKGECIYEESHNGISMDEIAEQISVAL